MSTKGSKRAAEILNILLSGDTTVDELAEKFSTTPQTIRSVLKGLREGGVWVTKHQSTVGLEPVYREYLALVNTPDAPKTIDEAIKAISELDVSEDPTVLWTAASLLIWRECDEAQDHAAFFKAMAQQGRVTSALRRFSDDNKSHIFPFGLHANQWSSLLRPIE